MTDNQGNWIVRFEEPTHVDRVSDEFIQTLTSLGATSTLTEALRAGPKRGRFRLAGKAWRRFFDANKGDASVFATLRLLVEALAETYNAIRHRPH
jgi:hypothetical protein